MKNIRNFAIIAHIDHGKSTLADRFLEITSTVDKRKMKEQFLDQMDLERERGITIKMQPVRMTYYYKGEKYILNLIDTPGHVDFTYEVSRSLAAVEGAILLVDATQGIQAQTMGNYQLAKKQNLTIIPAINKIDLPNAQIEEVKKELLALMGVGEEEIFLVSAKTGEGVADLLNAVIEKIPAPITNITNKTRALVFDSLYDDHKGVISYVRIVDGVIKAGEYGFLMASKTPFKINEVGIFRPNLEAADCLREGEIGYIVTGLKEPQKVRVGDTITLISPSKIKLKNFDFVFEEVKPLTGYQEPEPMVFASVYPISNDDINLLKNAILKLKLNDPSLVYKTEFFSILGQGFCLGFLGLLHLEIIKERLEREYKIDVIFTTPSVNYKVILKDKSEINVYRASDMPDCDRILKILEPWVRLEIITPQKYLGAIMELKDRHRLDYLTTQYLGNLLILIFEAPLSEIIVNFYDKLKSATEGYASMNYEFLEYRESDLVKLEILLAGEKEESLARIVHRQFAEEEGRKIVAKLKNVLPRQNFVVAIQAMIENKIIARENLPALKKDVTGYLYGGDRTRKMKLWKKQKEGKKRLKERGRVHLSTKTYLDLLKLD
ncbi:MAG: translation elongation factor 4 [Patescibacteria group bacterium]|nr:translation elongation factor 4 [Patescibacteria group bacterium]